MLELRTLGTIELRSDDGRPAESVLHHPKRLSLLAYLCASHPPRAHRRDTLVALLWPELDEAHARGALRQELYQLRRALGRGVLRGLRADTVQVDPAELHCDAAEFESALDEGRAADALELWHGEFLPGLHVDESEFEHWLDEVRERLTRRALAAANQLIREAEDAGDHAGAVAWARRAVELAPYDETGWQRLIALLDGTGDRAGALRAYESLAVRLRAELEVEPSPETRALVARIRERGDVNDTPAVGRAGIAPVPPGTRRRPGRAVIGLQRVRNRTGDPSLDALARRVTDRLAQALAGAMFIDVAPAGRHRGVSAIVSTALYLRGGAIEAVPRLLETGKAGRLVDMPRSVVLSRDPPDAMLDTLAAHILASVATHYDPRFDAAATVERALPIPTPLWEAYLEYLRGSELFGHAQYSDGYRHLLRAYEIDRDFVKAGLFAAIALAASGQPAEADALATRIMAADRPLCDYERGLGEWFLAHLHGRRVEAHRAAVGAIAVTSSPVVTFLAGREALWLNRPREAVRRLEHFEYGQGWWRDITEAAEVFAGAYHSLGSHRAELAVALEARVRFPGSLETLRAEVRARAALGEVERVQRLVEDALAFPAGMTTPADVAWSAAQELSAHGMAAAAVRARATGLEWLAHRAQPGTAEKQLRVRLLLELGAVDAAGRDLHALAPCEDLESLGLLGLVAAQAGDTVEACRVRDTLEGLENPYLYGRHLLLAAGIRAVMDPAPAALATLRRAFAAGLPFSVELHALPMLAPLAHHAEFRALLQPRG